MAGPVVTIGEPIVAMLPDAPVRLTADVTCRAHPGGAEANVSVGLRRLGRDAWFVGRVGDDPFGRLLLDDLVREGVGVEAVAVDASRPTAYYVREWLPDGRRRPTYYRSGSAGSALGPGDWRAPPATPALLHVTGITPALGPSPAAAVRAAIAWARGAGVPVSLDPNHRPWLWADDVARPALLELVAAAAVVLMSEEDRELLFPGATDDEALERCRRLGPAVVVLKRGAAGAIGCDGGAPVTVAAAPVDTAVDPVGAGDAFDAGFLAAHLAGCGLAEAMRLGALSGAAAVAAPGDHASALRLADLPADLASRLAR